MRQYSFDEERRIWFRHEHTSITYNDGDESENYLETVLKQAHDVSSTSPDLRSAIRDWPSEYHLSPVRHNLLRFCNIEPGQSILELGCGCGAITRYLGEIGAHVIAVEGSVRRASIAAERCRDLPNVKILCDNIAGMQLEQKFDVVTLIGVLEYAQLFIEADDPIQKCLQIAKSFLNENGVLIIAIENQLGLKYFNGCTEDHTGIPYFGINDLYAAGTPVTFGKHEIEAILNKAGFGQLEFFYPFPDYKLPTAILSEKALEETNLNLSDILLHHSGRDYTDALNRAFSEPLAWEVLHRNRLLSHLANSFLIYAGQKGSDAFAEKRWSAKLYSRGSRKIPFQMETVIYPSDHEIVRISKRKVFPSATSDQGFLSQVIISESTYIHGVLYVRYLHRVMAGEGDISQVLKVYSRWVSFLNEKSFEREGKRFLPGEYVDCNLGNLILKDDGTLVFFDAEWVSENPVPFAWILIRGVIYSLIGCMENKNLDVTYRDFIYMVAKHNNLVVTEDDFRIADELEEKMIYQCHADASQAKKLREVYDQALALVGRFASTKASWQAAEIDRIKSSFSWRVTAPLRSAHHLLTRIIKR